MLDTETPGSSDPEGLGLSAEELDALGQELDGTDDEPESGAAAAAPAAPSAPQTPAAPPAPVSGASAPAASTAAVPASPAVPGDPSPATDTPLVLKIDGRELPVQGTALPDGGVQFTKEQWGTIREKYVANRERWVEKEQGYKTRIQRLEQSVQQGSSDRTANDAKADALVGELSKLFKIENDEAYLVECMKLRRRMPQFLADAERDYWKGQAERGSQRLQPIDQAARWREAEPEFRELLENDLDRFLGQPAYAGLQGQRDQLFAELWRMGLEEGLIGHDGTRFVFDAGGFKRYLDQEARFAKRLAEEQERHKITTRNAQVLQPSAAPPAAIPVKGAVPASGSGERPKPKTKQEYLDRLREFANEPP